MVFIPASLLGVTYLSFFLVRSMMQDMAMAAMLDVASRKGLCALLLATSPPDRIKIWVSHRGAVLYDLCEFSA